MKRHSPNHVLQYVIQYKRENDGNSPSRRDICRDLGIRSTSHVNYLLNVLAVHGAIELVGRGRSRFIRVTGGEWTWTP